MPKILKTSPKFLRSFAKMTRNNKRLQADIERSLMLLGEDSNHPKLKFHPLKGALLGFSACSCGYDCRILFRLNQDPVTNEEYILTCRYWHPR